MSHPRQNDQDSKRAPWRRLVRSLLLRLLPGTLGATFLASSATALTSDRRPQAFEEARRIEARASTDRGRGAVAEAAAGFARAADHRFVAGASPSNIADRLDSLGRTFHDLPHPGAMAAEDSLLELAHRWRRRDPGATAFDLGFDHLQLARLAVATHRPATGLPHADSATVLFAAISDPSARLYGALARAARGRLSFDLGDYVDADASATAALSGMNTGDVEQSPHVFDALTARGEARRELGRLAEAEADFRAALEIAERGVADPAWRPNALNLMAGLYRDQERWDLAEPLLREALELSRPLEQNDPRRVATAVLNVSEALQHQGRSREAAPGYLEAVERARRAWPPGAPELVVCLQQAADCLRQVGREEDAERLLREAVTTARADSQGSPLPLAGAMHALAELMLGRGRVVAADSLARRSLALRERRLPADSRVLAESHELLARCAIAEGAGSLRDVEIHAGAVLRILGRSPLAPDTRLAAFAALAGVAEARGDTGAFDRWMASALPVVDELRLTRGGDASRVQFLRRALPMFDRVFDRAIAVGDLDRAFQTHERGRSRVLLENLAAPRALGGTDDRAAEPLVARLDTLRQQLTGLQARLDSEGSGSMLSESVQFERRSALAARRDSLVLEYARVRDAVRMGRPGWRDALARSRSTVGTSAVLAHARRLGEPVLVYHANARGSWLFSFLPGDRQPRLDTLRLAETAARALGVRPGPLDEARLSAILEGTPPGTGLLAALARGEGDTRGFSRVRTDAAIVPTDARLKLLFEALVPATTWRRIRHARTAVVIPDGGLASLPFEALVLDTGATASARRYWLDDGPALRVAPSASTLLVFDDRPRGPHRDGRLALSLYDVEYRDTSQADRAVVWRPLPGTRVEAERLRSALGAANVDTLSGTRATEAALREALPGHALVHLATHGFASGDESELLAGLVLARGTSSRRPDDDGRLQSYELPDLTLDASLVVLSACETNGGRRIAGEGVFALSRGFLAAGAQRVISALWSVPDDATAELMGGLFERLAPALRSARTPDAVLALRDAKRRVRRDPRWAAPSAWAAFTMSGRR